MTRAADKKSRENRPTNRPNECLSSPNFASPLLQSSIVVASWKEAAAAAAAAAIQLPEMGIEIASEIQSTKQANSNAS
jgi:hypothetical protein